MLVEQAIFTSATTDERDGYQLLGVSAGVSEVDRQALALWCPSHGALHDEGVGAQSVGFHGLPSGSFCVARTRPAGQEYSDREGERLHTHCLIAPSEVLARFANNPFALLQAAIASGALADADATAARELPPLTLVGRASAMNLPLVERLLTRIGPHRLASLVDAALGHWPLAIQSDEPLDELVAGLLNCLPVECRLEFSFATGLRYSPQRPFRLNAAGADPREWRRLERRFEMAVFHLDKVDESATLSNGWAAWLSRLLTTQGPAALAAHLVRPQPGLTCDELPTLAHQLETAGPNHNHTSPAPLVLQTKLSRAHAPHQRTQPAEQQPASRALRPAQKLAGGSAATLEQLEALDDAVYDAVAGKPGALEELAILWPLVTQELDLDLLEESREQYLRYAMSIWEEFLKSPSDPSRAVAALDVLCLLFDQ